MIHSPHIATGLATIIQALATIDAVFPKRASTDKKLIPTSEPNSDLSLYANFIQENWITLNRADAAPNTLLNSEYAVSINEKNKNRFINILSRVAKAQEGVSRQERLFVHQFWAELQQIFLNIKQG